MKNRMFSLLALSTAMAGLATTATAQESMSPIQFGLFGGVGYNMIAAGEDAAISANVPVTDDFVDGSRIVPYGGVVFTYNAGGDQIFGFHARVAYDDRSGDFGDSTDEVGGAVSYVSFEPGVLVNLGTPLLHLSAGPSAGLLVRNAFDYTPAESEDTTDEFDMLRDVAFGLWGNVSYDIALTDMSAGGSRLYLSPFLGASWMVDQVKPSEASGEDVDESWRTISLRGGIELRYGIGGN